MSGFLRGHSCCTALLKMVDDWILALDSKKITGSIAIDLSKAFDSICHNLLLAKLRAYGLNDDAIAFLQSYLTDRQQKVKFHGKFSEWCPVKCDVPQGSLFGPLLFNIFLNDLNFAGQISSLRLYADDTTTYASNRDIITLEISLNQDLNILVTWFSQNYLIVNSIKTQGMLLGGHTHVPEFFIGDTKVELENSLKILGVTIDTTVNIYPTCSRKSMPRLFFLRRLKRLMPHNVSLSLYKAYLLPHLEYYSPLLIGINKTLNSKLDSANKYALKTLLNLGNNLDYDTILSLSDMQSLEHRRYYSSLVILYKCMNSNGPQYIKNFFRIRYTKYNLRSRGINPEQSGYNDKFFHNSFTYIVSRLWNTLSAHIKASSKFSDFTRNLKAFDVSKLGPSCHFSSCI